MDNTASEPPAQPLLILGAPRSGTSLIAGLLDQMGMWTGHTVAGGPANPRGFFENWGIRETITKRQLVQLGGDPAGVMELPTLASTEQLSVDGMRSAIAGSMMMEGYTGGPWLYKDCKLTLLWPAWLKAFPEAKWLIIRRKDADIITSCLRTEFMRQHSPDFEFWKNWLQAYYDRLEALAEAVPEENLRSIYPEAIIRDRDYSGLQELAEWLGLQFVEAEADRFILPEAWHAPTDGREPIFSKTVLNSEMEQVESHVRTNLARGLPHPPPGQPNDLDLCIVAGGKSLSRQIGNIRKRQRRGASVMAMNGTHDFLIKNGIIPDAMVMLDSRAEDRNVAMVANPHNGVSYFIASQCDPRIFDALKDQQTFIWHSQSGIDWAAFFTEAGVEHPVIQGGTTVGMKCFAIAMYLGFRNFHLYGFDSCIWPDGKHHAYKQTLNDQDLGASIPLHIGNREFRCAGWMVRQVEDFKEMVDAWQSQIRLQVHGDGALAEVIREGDRIHAAELKLMDNIEEQANG